MTEKHYTLGHIVLAVSVTAVLVAILTMWLDRQPLQIVYVEKPWKPVGGRR